MRLKGATTALANYLAQKNKQIQDENSLGSMVQRATLDESGYDVTPNNRMFGGVFGGGFRVQRRPDYVSGKALEREKNLLELDKMKNPDKYASALEKAKTENYKSMGAGGLNQITGYTPDGDPIQKPLMGEDYLKTVNPQMRALIKGITDYAIDPTKTSSIRGNQRQQIINAAKQYDPSYDMTEFPARSSYVKDLKSGKRSTNILAANTLLKHLSSLNAPLDQVPSSAFRPVEAVKRGYFGNLAGGSPEAKAIGSEDMALNAVAGELANIFKQSGATDVEVKSWLDAYKKTDSKEVKREKINKAIELMQGRLESMTSEYERTMGKPYGKNFLSPEAEASIKKIRGKKPGGIEHTDANGNRAIVYPDGTYEEIS